MPKPEDTRHLDKRTADRYLTRGMLDPKAYDVYLKSLPDVSDKGVPIDTVMEDFIDDDVDEEDGEQA